MSSEVSLAVQPKWIFRRKSRPIPPIHRVQGPAKGVRDVRAELAEFSDKELVNLTREIDISANSGVSSPRVQRLLVLLGRPEVVEPG